MEVSTTCHVLKTVYQGQLKSRFGDLYDDFRYLDGHLDFLKGLLIKTQERSTVTFETMKITFLPCIENLVILQADIITTAFPKYRYNLVRNASNMDGILSEPDTV